MPLKSPQEYNPKISKRVNDAILQGMEFDLEKRPKFISQWLELLLPEKKTPTPQTPTLISVRNVDYSILQQLLAAGKWAEADKETDKVMLQVANRVSKGWLTVEDINNFPCEDLRTIDQLWVHYSRGKFAFSVQGEIYRSLGGTRWYNREIWEKFGDRVGWRKGGEWVKYSELDFHKKNLSANEGDLPSYRNFLLPILDYLPPTYLLTQGVFILQKVMP